MGALFKSLLCIGFTHCFPVSMLLRTLFNVSLKLCGGQGTAAWVRYEEISLEREAMTGRVLRAVYLLGAEDRERMLKLKQ